MEEEQYFVQQANRCYEIGRTCMDLAAARKINMLGDEFRKKAAELNGRRRGVRFAPRDSDRDFAA
jgi:hypothetical protein